MAVKTVEFELRYRKEGRSKDGGKMLRNVDRYSRLSDVPAQYTPITGGYKRVAEVATHLNDTQVRSGFLDYLFFPEVTTAPKGAEPLEADNA